MNQAEEHCEQEPTAVRSMEEYFEKYFGPQAADRSEPKLPSAEYGAHVAQRSLTKILREAGRL